MNIIQSAHHQEESLWSCDFKILMLSKNFITIAVWRSPLFPPTPYQSPNPAPSPTKPASHPPQNSPKPCQFPIPRADSNAPRKPPGGGFPESENPFFC